MKKLALYSLFKRTQLKRYCLVMLMFVLGGGGIFSEESTGHDSSFFVGFASRQPLLIRLQQKDFVVFYPVDYLHFWQKDEKTFL